MSQVQVKIEVQPRAKTEINYSEVKYMKKIFWETKMNKT